MHRLLQIKCSDSPDRVPILNLSDVVFSLYGVKFLTSLDLVRGYSQMPLEELSREYTAFLMPRSHWQFMRLSYGLRNAPAAFQHEMQHVLSRFPRRKIVVYIDDVLTMSETFEEHLHFLNKVLETLVQYGVKVKPEKCCWFAREVEYLAHVMSSEGLRKPQSFVEKIKDFP